MIDLQNVSISYKIKKNLFRKIETNQALSNFNFLFEKEKFYGIIGPSGSGKSTLLKFIAGLLDKNISNIKGNLFLRGINATYIAPFIRNISYVPQSLNLYPHFSVYQNLEFPLKMRNISKDLRTSEIEEIASSLEIDDILSRKPKQLSGGQKQRVALGKAFISKSTDVVLFDEPFNSLDILLKSKIISILKKLNSNYKKTSLFVTHDIEEVNSLADEILIIIDGNLIQAGKFEFLFNNPINLPVARLVRKDEINLFTFSFEYYKKEFSVFQNSNFSFKSKFLEKHIDIIKDDFIISIDMHNASLCDPNTRNSDNVIKSDLATYYYSLYGSAILLKCGFKFIINKNISSTFFDKELFLSIPNDSIHIFKNDTSNTRII